MKGLIFAMFVAFGVLAIGAIGSLSAGEGSQDEASTGSAAPAHIVFEGRLGNVNFDHLRHTEWVPDCQTCHHIGGYQECGDCHAAESTDIPSKNNALHMQCKGCHKQKGHDTGCNTCHVK